jgi:predicted MFS family arabinose efflux permease
MALSHPSLLQMRRPDSDASVVIASCLLGAAGYGFYSGLPVILGGLADSRGLPDALLGWIASAEILGLLLGGLVATAFTGRARRRPLAAGGLLLLAGAHLGTMSPEAGLFGLLAARLAGGLGGGCIYAIGVSSLAVTRNPARNVAVFTAVLVLVATAEVGVLPEVIKRGGPEAAILLLLGLAALGVAGIVPLPKDHGGVSSSIARRGATKVDRSVWPMLAGIACFHVAPVIYWTYGERIGIAGGIPESSLGVAFAAAGILGALSCFGTEHLARRLGQRGSLLLVTVLLIVGLLSWLVGTLTPGSYLIRACLIAIPWTLGGVYQVNLANEIDPSGRLSALVGPAQNVGLMVGPAIASTLLSARQSFTVVLCAAAAFLVLSMILSVARRRSR